MKTINYMHRIKPETVINKAILSMNVNDLSIRLFGYQNGMTSKEIRNYLKALGEYCIGLANYDGRKNYKDHMGAHRHSMYFANVIGS